MKFCKVVSSFKALVVIPCVFHSLAALTCPRRKGRDGGGGFCHIGFLFLEFLIHFKTALEKKFLLWFPPKLMPPNIFYSSFLNAFGFDAQSEH